MSDNLIALADRIEHGEIRALSIKQPYPHHIFHSGKDVENRAWPTRWQGWSMVHAGKSRSMLDQLDPPDLPLGGIVGMMKITGCVEQSDSEWFFGRYGFLIRKAFPLPLVQCRGMLGFFSLEAATLAAVADQVRAHARAIGQEII